MTLRILAVDTATEQCSVALDVGSHMYERVVPTVRGHADMILGLVDEVLHESGHKFADLDGLAFGRGPGSFTGVRIAVGVAQGLALATQLSVVGISNLAAVAYRCAVDKSLTVGDGVLVCMDARMNEVYCAHYQVDDGGLVTLTAEERVMPPDRVLTESRSLRLGVGTGWRTYPVLRERFVTLEVDDQALPRAREIVILARREFVMKRGLPAAKVEPVYVRDQVAWTTSQRGVT